MECNKEEAIRAKTIAEQKLELKDFIGAKKLALVAQRLFPELDLSQMIKICEIHCSAAVKTNGIEDWYRILEVEPSADDYTLKKQYQKLAFLLHPDKNKFRGAEAAFKIVCAAHRVLSDRLKHSAYDACRASARHAGPKTPDQPPDSVAKATNQCPQNFRNSNAGLQQQQLDSESESAMKTFWTFCPYCRIRYRYYQSVMNRSLYCQYCMRPFTAFDMHAQNEVFEHVGISSTTGWCTKESDQQHILGNTSSRRGTDVESSRLPNGDKNDHCGTLTDKNKKQNGGNFEKDAEKKSATVQPEEVNVQTMNSHEVLKGNWMLEENIKANHSRGSDIAEAFSAAAAEKSVHEFVSLKKQKMDATVANADQNQANFPESLYGINWEGKPLEKAGNYTIVKDEYSPQPDGVPEQGVDSMTDLKVPIVNCSVPDPEFCDFELLRNSSSFRVGQIWALYDDFDEMPRFYAEIKRVSSHGFKVCFAWLEYDPASESEKHWSARKLPVACGNYKSGKTQKSKEIAMFSHVMPSGKGAKRNAYKIRPNKGEIWAMYEGWDISWIFETENQQSRDFQIVEIVSDNLADDGVGVRLLTKVQGFVSVFTKAPNQVNSGELVYIPPDELLRFSHMIPSYKLTGKEREGIPESSYELDTAALPSIFFPSASIGHDNAANMGISPCSGHATARNQNAPVENRIPLKKLRERTIGVGTNENLCSNEGNSTTDFNQNDEENLFGCEHVKTEHKLLDRMPLLHCQGDSKNMAFFSKAMGADSKIAADCQPSSSKSFDLAASEFHKFDEDKSFKKLESGQVWALYSDLDGLPRYYALIKDVDALKVTVVWLEACPELVEEVLWFDKGLLLGCGRFMPVTGKDSCQIYDTLDAFSHQMNAQLSGEQKTCNIYPHVGEIWAMYKNWSVEWKESDFSHCEYDIVEICSTTDEMIKVQFLEKVEGFFAVFMRRKGMLTTLEIPLTNVLKFSHRIPSFLLTNERDGKLRGSWELDPASVPERCCFLQLEP